MDFKLIGHRITEQRKKRNLTQAAFSEALGVSEGYVSQIERGIATISLKRLESIANVLQIDIGLLVSNQVSLPGTPINRDVCELIKDWSPQELNTLIAHLKCANQFRSQNMK